MTFHSISRGALFGCPHSMLVYRNGGRQVETARELARIRRSVGAAPGSPDLALGLLIELGEFESGVVDARCRDRDAIDPAAECLRASTVEAAHLWLAAREGERDDPRAIAIANRLHALQTIALPPSIELRVSEGYAYYALHPAAYAASARRFLEQSGARRAHVIGIRSIGTSLSAVVVAALRQAGCDAGTSTVRPRGHPFDREVRLSDELAAAFRHDAAGGASFLLVDEGPGISGSSFASVASALRRLDVPPERVALFPSWDPDPEALRSESAQRIWGEHQRYYTSAHADLDPAREYGITGPIMDFSAGQWRPALAGDESDWPAVHPQHERRKLFVPSRRRLIRFAGLGHYGAAVSGRAAQLARLGIGPQPGALRAGFLDLPFVDGSPLRRCESADDAVAIGRYIGRIAASFPTGDIVDPQQLNEMVDTNLRGMARAPQLEERVEIPAVALDGRMLPHEWIRTTTGLVKVDALDHHGDHFWPGPQSPAWDLAGAITELRMDRGHRAAMLDAFERACGGRMTLAWLPFYLVAYAAFRFGYATLAAQTLRGTADAARFNAAAQFYSQCALNATACLTASPKSPLKQIARSSMNT